MTQLQVRSPGIGSRCLERVPGIEERARLGYAALFDPRSGATHSLNASASAVWWLCDGSRTVEQIGAEISSLFGVAETTARADVANLIVELIEAGAVHCE